MSAQVARRHRPTGKWGCVTTDFHAHLALRLPDMHLPDGGAFTHLTAARLLGMRMPPLPAGCPLFVTVPRSCTRPQEHGVISRRHVRPPAVDVVHGLPVVDPVSALVAAAAHLGVLDLTCMVDGLLARADDPKRLRSELAAEAAVRRRGSGRLAAAVDVADARAESWFETVLREFYRVAEVPVEPQFEVRVKGEFVARADLRVSGTEWIYEYDGGIHRDPEVHRRDLLRERALADSPFRRRGYTSDDLLHRHRRMLREVDDLLGRPYDVARHRRWIGLVHGSLMTPVGTAAVVRTWERQMSAATARSRRAAA